MSSGSHAAPVVRRRRLAPGRRVRPGPGWRAGGSGHRRLEPRRRGFPVDRLGGAEAPAIGSHGANGIALIASMPITAAVALSCALSALPLAPGPRPAGGALPGPAVRTWARGDRPPPAPRRNGCGGPGGRVGLAPSPPACRKARASGTIRCAAGKAPGGACSRPECATLSLAGPLGTDRARVRPDAAGKDAAAGRRPLATARSLPGTGSRRRRAVRPWEGGPRPRRSGTIPVVAGQVLGPCRQGQRQRGPPPVSRAGHGDAHRWHGAG